MAHSCWKIRKWLRIAVICLTAMVVLGVGLRMVLPTLPVAGGNRDQVWRAEIRQRWFQNWEEACASVEQKPFPLREGNPL